MSETMERPFSTAPVGYQKDTGAQIVIIGSGAAGLAAAAAVRARNATCRITLLDDENTLSYSRPMLTKAPLRGFDPSVFTVFGPAWYAENRIEARTGAPATAVDPAAQTVTLAGGETLFYDKCILATGASCFFPPIPGIDQAAVHGVRGLGCIAGIRSALPTARKAVLIGGGVIGLEMAWELQKAGLELAVLEVAPTLMGRLLDAGSATLLEQRLAAAGVAVRTGVQVEAITGENDVANGVRLSDGSFFPAEMVIISCGVAANKALAAAAGAEVGRAIVVNERMETSLPNLYACGDCAELAGMNLAVWPEAVEQGRVAGAGAAGDATPYAPGPAGVLLAGFGTHLYALGDTGKTPDTAYEVLTLENEAAPAAAFLVNSTRQARTSYERYFFAAGRLVGGVLMDSLLPMEALKTGVMAKMDRDDFMRLRKGAIT